MCRYWQGKHTDTSHIDLCRCMWSCVCVVSDCCVCSGSGDPAGEGGRDAVPQTGSSCSQGGAEDRPYGTEAFLSLQDNKDVWKMDLMD